MCSGAKRIGITLLLAVVLFALVLPAATIAYAASDIPAIIVSDSTGKAGDTVDVSVSLSNNPGIIAMRLHVEYDEAALRLVRTIDKGVLGNATHYPGPAFHSPYILMWVNGTARSNYDVNGEIATMKFEILKDTNSTPITVTYDLDKYDILNADDQKVKFSVKNGTVSTVPSKNPEKEAAGSDRGEELSASGSEANQTSAGQGSPNTETSANQGPSNTDTALNTSNTSNAAETAATETTEAAKETVANKFQLFSKDGIPLANSETGQTIPSWIWILIAALVIAAVMIVIINVRKRRKNGVGNIRRQMK